jgi:hypothetical protein
MISDADVDSTIVFCRHVFDFSGGAVPQAASQHRLRAEGFSSPDENLALVDGAIQRPPL